MREEQRVWPWALGLVAVRVVVIATVLGLAFYFGRPMARAAELAWEDEDTTTQMVIPMGRAVGIKLFSDGVMVVGLSEVTTDEGNSAPAKDCGLQAGDIITHINSEEVDTIEEVYTLLQGLEGDQMTVRAMRGETQVQVTTQAVQCSTDGSYKLGAWIRDSMAGIGTMTFYDPETGCFGALGHGVNDVDTSQLMPLQSGGIMYAEVTDVLKGASGSPGELHGAIEVTQELGDLYANTGNGVFGHLTQESMTDDLTPIAVATRDEIEVGAASILSNIAGNEVTEYQVEVSKIYPDSDSDSRDMMITVTDPALIEATGGIVQGMSGSPIIQNGKIIGAVTHVFVNDPTCGYGISIEEMLETAQTTDI